MSAQIQSTPTPSPNFEYLTRILPDLSDIDVELMLDAQVWYEDQLQRKVWMMEELKQQGKLEDLQLKMMLSRYYMMQDRQHELMKLLKQECIRRKIRRDE